MVKDVGHANWPPFIVTLALDQGNVIMGLEILAVQ
jgi:hypothetical protein